MGFGLFDTMFTVVFVLIFLMVIGIFLSSLARSIGKKRKDDRSPRLTVEATVVAKRADVSHHNRGSSDMPYSNTNYYVTFQVASGDRMELHVAGYDYGMLVEGDRGKLSFQGSRFLGFERT